MKVFELYFNPKKRRDSIFDSFIYDPENQEEKNLGSLCMAGELNKTLPQNRNFLSGLADTIKNGFYGKSDLSEALKEANDFLDKEAKSGNVNWLGNLNFAVINVKDSVLNFTKVGNIKVLLLRDGEVLDISQNLELQDQEPYPMKVFSNIALGKLLAQDKILILTQDVFSAISQEEMLLSELNRINNEKELKQIFKLNKDAFSEISGLCLLISENNISKEISLPIFKRMPKGVILIIGFILILAVAYFIFKDKKETPLNQSEFEERIELARSKIMMAENFIIFKKEEEAKALFQEAWAILLPISESDSYLKDEASNLQNSIKNYLNK